VADLADVEAALVTAIGSALEIVGNGPNIGGSTLRIYRGWPTPAGLQADQLLGVTNISIFSVPGSTKNTTRWGLQSAILANEISLAALVEGNQVKLCGVPLIGTLTGVLADGVPFVHLSTVNESADVVAAILADKVRTLRPCALNFNCITIPGSHQLIARIAQSVTILQETQRQSQDIRVSVFSPTPSGRDQICGSLISSISQIGFILLSDGSSARIRFHSTASFDDAIEASIYRRDIVYNVEYGTTFLEQLPALLFGDLNINSSAVFA